MQNNNQFISCCNRMLEYMNQSSQMRYVSRSSDQIQSSTNEFTIMLGLHSLRFVVVNNINNTAITITPADVVDNDVVLHTKGTTISIFNAEETISKDFSTLLVDGGELFQLSLVHNCDFGDMTVVLQTHKKMLAALSDSKIKHNTTIMAAALENVQEALQDNTAP